MALCAAVFLTGGAELAEGDGKAAGIGEEVAAVAEAVRPLLVAELLRIRRWSVYQLIWSGRLESLTIGRRRLIRPAAYAACLDQLDQKAA